MNARTIRAPIRRFRRAQEGSIALMAGLAALPMLLVGGGALDFVHASGIKARLQSSLDAGALAAASSKSMSDAERIALANAVFARNWNDPLTDDLAVNPSFGLGGDKVTASATVEVPATFMQLAGISTLPVDAAVIISVPGQKKAEVALVLDYSKSMEEVSGGKVKYIAMKNAAIKLANDLEAAGKDKVKIGLVPFSHQIYVTLPKTYVNGQAGAGTWSGCTQDRLYPLNVSDATPVAADDATKWNQSVLTVHGNCSGYLPRNLTILPLTDDIATVAGRLAVMTPYAYTHIALGVEFGWHLLSPNAPFSEGAAYDDKSTEKFMVALTDGRQTEPSFGPGGSREDFDGEANLETLCEKAKDTGITMITIAFDLRDKDTENRLRECSSDPDKHFFIAEDAADIAQAFEEIKRRITAQVFVSQ